RQLTTLRLGAGRGKPSGSLLSVLQPLLALTHLPKAFEPFPFAPYFWAKALSPENSRSALQNFAEFLKSPRCGPGRGCQLGFWSNPSGPSGATTCLKPVPSTLIVSMLPNWRSNTICRPSGDQAGS